MLRTTFITGEVGDVEPSFAPLQATKGSPLRVVLRLRDDRGVPLDAATGVLAVRARETGAEATFTVSGTAAPDYGDGCMAFALSAADTLNMDEGIYAYDVWVRFADDSTAQPIGVSEFRIAGSVGSTKIPPLPTP